MSRRTSARATAVLLGAALALTGCGGGGSGVVARVGDATITRTALEHWVKVLAAGDPPPTGSARHRALSRRALRLLISADWLLGEARERNVAISPGDVEHAVASQQRTSFPGGAAEMSSFLATTGETRADLRLEAAARLAAQRVRAAVLDALAPPSAAEVADYYRGHAARFVVPERRTVWITNRKTVAAAKRIRHEVAEGTPFTSLSHRETFVDPRHVLAGEPSRPLKLAVARARVGVLVGPTKARVDDFVFEVARIEPTRRQSLAEVSDAIASRLAREARRRALAAAVATWDRGWTARTDCATGYVVELCRQFRGRRAQATAFALR